MRPRIPGAVAFACVAAGRRGIESTHGDATAHGKGSAMKLLLGCLLLVGLSGCVPIGIAGKTLAAAAPAAADCAAAALARLSA